MWLKQLQQSCHRVSMNVAEGFEMGLADGQCCVLRSATQQLTAPRGRHKLFSFYLYLVLCKTCDVYAYGDLYIPNAHTLRAFLLTQQALLYMYCGICRLPSTNVLHDNILFRVRERIQLCWAIRPCSHDSARHLIVARPVWRDSGPSRDNGPSASYCSNALITQRILRHKTVEKQSLHFFLCILMVARPFHNGFIQFECCDAMNNSRETACF